MKKGLEMLLAGDIVDPDRKKKLIDESSMCLLPDDQVNLAAPLNLSTSMNNSKVSKSSFFNCCSCDSAP